MKALNLMVPYCCGNLGWI